MSVKNDLSIILPLLFLAISLRLLFWPNIQVGFDQVQIIENAQRVIALDPMLIGPRTGPAAMFTGPLLYYLAAPFVWLFGSLYSVPVVPAAISFVTGLVFYYLAERTVGKKIAVIALCIWTVSPFTVSHDRTLWNPNLLFLSATLVLFPSLWPKKYNFSAFLLFVGGFLSYQAHFSGFLLVALGVINVVFFARAPKYAAYLLAGLCASLAPTLLFDLRHDWLNTRGLLALLSGQTGGSPRSLLPELGAVGVKTLEVLGGVFVDNKKYAVFVAPLFFALAYTKKIPSLLTHSLLLWLAVTLGLYTLYSGQKPEYYFVFLLPVCIVCVSSVLSQLTRLHLTLLGVLFVFLSVTSIYGFTHTNAGFSIQNINTIQELAVSRPVSQVAYDTEYGSDYGVQFYLSSISLDPSGTVFHVVHPVWEPQDNFITLSPDVAVWFEEK
ncbi:MAG: hypothetical protein H6774_03095 [Pseudomonadales bacterium]|nr:hypothetical protein [Candidatus Woesebacteria bacterium]MCB9802050.1 hypothetical protein [Pseudomonadales bacterium]